MQLLLDAQREVLALIARNAPLQESLSAIARFSERWIPGMQGSILRYNDDIGRLNRGGYGKLPSSFADIVDGLVPGPLAGSCGACAYLRERVISDDVFVDPRWGAFHDLCRSYSIRSAWSSPLLSSRDGRLLGVFGMYHEEVRKMSADDEALVDHFAALAALAIERSNDDATLQRQATQDVLTRLGNRRLLEAEGSRLFAEFDPQSESLCAVFIDLDNFKAINDTFGHSLADLVLAQIAETMRQLLGTSALITRFGGDEFVILFREGREQSLTALELLRQTLGRGVTVGSLNLEIRFSAGLVDHTADRRAENFTALISASDDMARRAKAAGGDRCIAADEAATAAWAYRHALNQQLSQALAESDAIDAHLQPIIALADGGVRGFELLMRLRDPALASASIADCIEVAEQSGLVHEIGFRMLQTAFDLLERYPSQLAGRFLNVNVSVRQMMSRTFPDWLRRMAIAHPASTKQICLEITESEWLDPLGPAGDLMREIHGMGFRLALDDFGTGHASLSYLQALPFDTVKMDRFFIKNLENSSQDSAFCTALLAMARSYGMTAVAEGVETEGQASRLAEMGYDRAQGFLWSRPLRIADALAWLEAGRGSVRLGTGVTLQ